MRQRKSQHITRKNYYLTPADKQKILAFIRNNPDLTNTFIGDKFDVSRGTISNLRKELNK